MSIGDNIRRYRRQNKMTQIDLANKINKSLRTIQKYEANETKPSAKVLRDISDIFNIYIEDLTNEGDRTDIYSDVVSEYIDQRIARMTDDEILTRKNKIVYENELENNESLYDKLDGKQLELLYLSKINDLNNLIQAKSEQLELSYKLNENLNQMVQILLKCENVDDYLDKKAEERMLKLLNVEYGNDNDIIDKIISYKAEKRAWELFNTKNEIKKILEGDADGK